MTKVIIVTNRILPYLIFLLMIGAIPAYAASKVDLPQELSDVKIPAEQGRISEYHRGSTPFTIFYIQDAHVNIEAQRNIAKIIEMFHKTRQLYLVLVEGGIGDVSLSEYRVGPKEKRIEIAEQLLKEGKISGEEYLNFVEEYPLLLWGIESQVLYDENLIAFTKAEPLMKDTLDKLGPLKDAIQRIKSALYSKDYLDFEKKLDEFSSKNDLKNEAILLVQTAGKLGITLTEYPNVQVLSSLIDIEAGADFEKVDYERTQLVKNLQRKIPSEQIKKVLEIEKSAGNDSLKKADFYEALIKLANDSSVDTKPFPALRSAVPYLRKQDKIDSIAFFSEKDKLADVIARKSLTNADALKLYQMASDVRLLELLAKLELVPDHYQIFVDNRDRFKVAGWADFLKSQSKTVSLPPDLPKLDETIDSFQSFYRIANIRDQALVENLTEKIKDEKTPEAVLIAGGFHKDRLVTKLHRIGFNVVIISPNVGLGQGQELYRRMLTEKWENGRWYIKEEQKK